MTAVVGRLRTLLIHYRRYNHDSRLGIFKEKVEQKEWRIRNRERYKPAMPIAWLGTVLGVAGSCAAFFYFLDESVKAIENVISLPRYPWKFNGVLTSLDHATVRRGWLVYRTVCYTCHSLRYVRFHDLVETSHTSEEAKAIAAEFEVEDGPDEEGNYYKRPGKLSDLIPPPYPTEEMARAANFGSYPPDLTYIVFARVHGTDYVFSLITGWTEPPAGVHIADGQYFNPYFPGGTIAMGQMLFDGMIEYEDGTPATVSQMAKDVIEFLSWTASQEHDTRKIMTLKCTGIMTILIFAIAYMYRRSWSHLRSRRLAFVPKRN